MDLPERLRFDRRAFERFFASPASPTHWIRATLHDAERIPEGAALLVGNHGPLGLDTPLLAHALYERFGRTPRPLADRLMFRFGPGRMLAKVTASVEGTPDNALALLEAGEWVLVYPGGSRETQRGRDARYQLRWGDRQGFVRVALRAGAPIVPVACLGNDDAFVQLRSSEQMAQTLPGRLVTRLVGRDYVLPLMLPVPRRLAFHYYFGEPIQPGHADPDSADQVATHRQRVREALETLLAEGLERRRQRKQDAR